jgi:hypothetical protein
MLISWDLTGIFYEVTNIYTYYIQIPEASEIQDTGHKYEQKYDYYIQSLLISVNIYLLICSKNMEGFVRHYLKVGTHL